jgi:hypothetical protein
VPSPGESAGFTSYIGGLKEIEPVRDDIVSGRESSKRVQTGEPNSIFRDVRYLIDFIATISDASPGLTEFD